ncbi:MAG: anaerobic sulfite reductase subunit A [Anaerolineaceae bacterium]|nr:MAG: anaerobic sulfite reductase subunit A [Anaerolineaceae bacterium]
MTTPKAERTYWLISQAELEAWLDGMAAVRTLVALRDVAGVLLYRQVSSSGEIAWSEGKMLPDGTRLHAAPTGRSKMSMKEICFPLTERMFTIRKDGKDISLEETFPDKENIVFGIHPCDARGIKLLDAVFLDTNPVDAFYARRRANTTLIGLACKGLGPTCFCTSVGGAPDDPRDVDIMFYETENGYLVQVVTEKGRFLILAGEWREATSSEIALVKDQPKTGEGQFRIPERSKWPKHFDDANWLKMAERCLSCRACSYVCPSCRCFTVRDEMLAPGEFERLRCWDACAGPNYRRVAGGHRLRPEKGERLRNRFFCKFVYFPEQYGLGDGSACTGCGRCIDVCPVGMDITEMLTDLWRVS